ncbi:MAG TPA: ATP-binding protein [Polyangium sp.]|nr:ATP-binding protein [Polyangium sp.]
MLVGKNGAGKSLIIEGLNAVGNGIVSGIDDVPLPKSFRCRSTRTAQPGFTYEFEVEEDERTDHGEIDETDPREQQLKWSERCKVDGINNTLWFVENSRLTLHNEESIVVPHDEGLVAIATRALIKIDKMPVEATQLADFFFGLQLVSAGIPRGSESRHEILLRRYTRGKRQGWRPVVDTTTTMNDLALTILRMNLYAEETFGELVELLQQIELVHDVSIHRYEERTNSKESYAAVHFDGVNIGLCSDGTQRIAQIIVRLLDPTTRCLLIEEPETAVHPGLLARLLAILDAYSHDRQIIIATHSPQIVDWCKPQDLRLVERNEGQTRVRKLDENELGRVFNYLTHDGTLSDFVYRQSSE